MEELTILSKSQLGSKATILLNSIKSYFNTNNNINKMIPIITGKSKISLRVLDWLVTNYAKKNNIIYELSNSKIKHFNMYLEYKSQLKAYSKKYFDPFCRKDRISFCIDKKEAKFIITTIAQLNFFKWALKYNVLTYLENNFDIIYHDMVFNKKNNNSSSDKSSTSSGRKTRTELSECATKKLNKHNIPMVLSFR
jgi:hypothetical protein